MRIDWCWACLREHPMLDDETFDAVMRAYKEAVDAQPCGEG